MDRGIRRLFPDGPRVEFLPGDCSRLRDLRTTRGDRKVFDWREAIPLVEQMKQTVNVVVAGGLTPTNVSERSVY